METFSVLLAICVGNSPVPGEFPAQRPVTQNFDVFFDLRLINGWVNNREAGDLRHNRANYDVIIMISKTIKTQQKLMHNLFNVLSFRLEKIDLHIVLGGPLYHKRWLINPLMDAKILSGLHIKVCVQSSCSKFNVVHICANNQCKWAQTPLLWSCNWNPGTY